MVVVRVAFVVFEMISILPRMSLVGQTVQVGTNLEVGFVGISVDAEVLDFLPYVCKESVASVPPLLTDGDGLVVSELIYGSF